MTDTLERLRTLCLAFPEVSEQSEGSVGDPVFKVRDKIFAMRHAVDGRSSVWCKAPRGMQEVLVNAHPGRCFVPPYVGRHGWVGLWLDDDTDWGLVAELVDESYRMTAPKRLIARYDEARSLVSGQRSADRNNA